MKRLLSFLLLVRMIDGLAPASVAADPIAIGSNRELFLDNHVIEKISGDAQLAVDVACQGLPLPLDRVRICESFVELGLLEREGGGETNVDGHPRLWVPNGL